MNDAATSEEFDLEDEDEFDGDSEQGKKKLSGKKIVLFFVLPAVIVMGAGMGLIFSGVFGSEPQEVEQEAKDLTPVSTVFFDLPEMLVNLNTTARRPIFLKIQVSLEIENESDINRLRALSPRIIDNFQVYLRELRIEDLRGSSTR